MSKDIKITRVNLDGLHSLEIAVNEKSRTVVAEMIVGEESTFIYAEKFDSPCNYLREAIKKSIVYLNKDKTEANYIREKKKENTVFA
ncbi:MAG: hypothetical protein IJD78_06040 [Clostridia bacterium]|nr:hypothetical protein [Clostridia bacterium]MBQ3007103.1 hypothetical protein [Clostridia bacterium]